MDPNGKYFKYPRPELSISKTEQKRLAKTGHCQVTFPVSYAYNGGIILTPDGKIDINCKNPKSKWYNGYKVPSPKIPKGYELVGIGVGCQLNAHPPYATEVLRKKVGKKTPKTPKTTKVPKTPLWVPLSGIDGVSEEIVAEENTRITKAETGGVAVP
jgi:hypothetical protein